MDAELALRLAQTASVARLATLEHDGRSHVVPIVFTLDGATLYTAVDHKPKRTRTLRRIENARARPDVTVLIDRYDDDWNELWWVMLRGRARVHDDGAEAERALDLLVAKYEQYRDRRPGVPVLALDVQESRGWQAARH
jgi:PPOX class probable F420-dependent enzyme